MKTNVTGSIVLYNTDNYELEKVVSSILSTSKKIKLYLVDNSPTNVLRYIEDKDSRIEYVYNPSNPGFGAAHNIAIQKALEEGSKYHFIVNPDIHFQDDVIAVMTDYMENNPDVGMMMPEVLNEDGSVQYLPKLLPNPFSILLRKIKRPKFYYKGFINKYELRFVDKHKIYNTPILSGCFTLLNVKAVQEVGMYDDAYFMYLEDWDLSRRMHQKYKTLYFPKVSVYHGYAAESGKNINLFKIHIKSAITYFNRWGWFFDKERISFNKAVLKQFDVRKM